MIYYFAYGSNMCHKQMKERCPSSEFVEKGILKGYRFVYDGYSTYRKGAVANIVNDESSVVEGCIFLITKEDERKLDKYEGYPYSYCKKRVTVTGESGKVYEAFTYFREGEKVGNPSEEYKKIVHQGARDCGLSEEYIKRYILQEAVT